MIHTVDSPLGPLGLAADGQGALVYLGFLDHEPRLGLLERLVGQGGLTEDRRLLRAAEDQLSAYFQGTRSAFQLALAPRGTPFQLRVWDALQEIPFGRTLSYGANPISIIIPCHRVIGTDGSLTGYAGGLDLKRQLLEREGVLQVAML